MFLDWRGQEVTASSAATVEGIDAFAVNFLAYENGAGKVLKAADEDPDSTLANAYAAMLWMFMERADAPTKARPYLARAQKAARLANERERMVLGAVEAWVDGDVPRAIRVGEELLDRYPREMAIAKACQYHHFNLGDPPGMLRVAHKVMGENADLPWTHGLAAFAYEQSHMLADAERCARQAIAIRRKEPWAHHALAHVFLTQGRTGEARAFLEDVKESWTNLNSFMFTHAWWHFSLVLIDQGETDRILSFYDQNIWGVWKEYSQDQIGAVSLLSRLEMVGVDVGDRWQDLGNYLATRVHDHVQPFLSMQYLYGLARAGRPEADAMMASIREHARTCPVFARPAWSEVAVPACEGLLAHARGDGETTVRKMGIALPRLTEIGGSHAQRGLFEQVMLDALIRTGRYVAAQQILEQMRGAYPDSRPLYPKLEDIYVRLGLPEEAARIAAAAKARGIRGYA
ncbi:MAG TPA: tetratricopeptide repeat protein [Geminicoccus sp.]|jgi:tetratricopeptide (TPR) repeat protein|uniref:tetratricopeptide repeat protein n=1 Tax=Geminicoccus sp. TaxID=2024832 RepID=UPI002E329B9B|nr:tetratricopeptide repeat protein [Geminicoccus sp.]HEX2529159.1 tetratricopeptide repeat protein [Geminicoccus sp.]